MLRTRGSAGFMVWVLVVASACFGRTPAQAPAASASAVLAGELELAKQELARNEYDEAAARLNRLVNALPATDPVGGEARALLAKVYFELGAYAEALATAKQVAVSGPGGVAALEVRGVTELFQCAFEDATKDLWSLGGHDEAAASTWIGVLDAWLGQDAAAEQRLTDVAQRFGTADEAPLARFYLVQLYLWAGNQAAALRAADELDAASPGYFASLRGRAENWLQRGVHLMRTFFTYDTLSRLGYARGDLRQATSDNDRASAALNGMEQTDVGCAGHVPRLREAWSAWSDVLAAAAPPPDRDGDGTEDGEDGCPDEPETLNGVADDDGCPDSAAIEIRGNQILISSGFAIYFATGSDEILPTSQPVLGALVMVLTSPSFSWIRELRIDGHTDDVGDDAANDDLSIRRARAVVAALVAAGVSADVLDARGWGESRPLVRETTEEARAINRRVEMYVVDPPIFGGARGR
ncbi:MAG: OmpA family protein [Deltaproteobacteria bacterium]|nr:OmpA family protein [Deltaproteobacteria bacterium]